MTIGDYIRDLAQNFSEDEVQLQVDDTRYSPGELSRRLDSGQATCGLVTQSGSDGCFILDPVSQQRVIQIHWSPQRRGWYIKAWPPNTRVHCYKMASSYLVSLCGVTTVPADTPLAQELPSDSSLCKACGRLQQENGMSVHDAATQTIQPSEAGNHARPVTKGRMRILVLREGWQFGPFSKKELKLRLSLKYFEPNLWAWHAGLPEWKPLYEVIPVDSIPKHPDIHSCSEECKEGGIATLSQLNYLRSLGVEYPCAISKQEAGALLGAHATRVTAGQKQRLEFYGVSSAGMTKESASRCLDELNNLYPEKEEEYFRWLDKRREQGTE